MVYEWDDDRAVNHQPFAGAGMGDIGKLVGTDAKLLCNELPAARRLVQKVHKIAVFKLILSRCFVQFCKKIRTRLLRPCPARFRVANTTNHGIACIISLLHFMQDALD